MLSMGRRFYFAGAVLYLFLSAWFAAVSAGQVAIYTAQTSWITPEAALAQAEICASRLRSAGIEQVTIFSEATPEEEEALAEWALEATGNGELDVLILFGYLPSSLYPAGNAQPDGSIIELFLESTDGDAVLNHADWMFYVSDPNNGPGGLQNITDMPAITMGPDNVPMVVTDRGREIAPSLHDFLSDRALALDQLSGDWFVEVALAQNADGTRGDPVIVRDGERGRIIPVFMTGDPNPMGAVAAEIIAYLFGTSFTPEALQIQSYGVTVTNTPARLKICTVDEVGIPTPTASDVTVNLTTDSGTGAFDTVWNGPYDGSVTSVTIPAGQACAVVYYKETAAKDVGITATDAAGNLTEAMADLTVLEDQSGEPGEVAIYTGQVNWITLQNAQAQAQRYIDALETLGIDYVWFQTPEEASDLADWLDSATGNGAVDVLILFGYTPTEIYGAGNTEPDGSYLELFIESTDGDMVLNHADWMFYVSDPLNREQGLQNIMDIPDITMGPDDTPVKVTQEGRAIAPTVTDFKSDRPFHLDQLRDNWFPEAVLAEDGAGTRADPCIVRDGNLGRLCIVYQTASQNDPRGQAAAEIIAWLYGKEIDTPTSLLLSGQGLGLTDKPVQLKVTVGGVIDNPVYQDTPVQVSLSSTSATGAFDTSPDGAFDGSVTTVTIPAGSTSAVFYYKDSTPGEATITAQAAGLSAGTMDLRIFDARPREPGEVAIYTGRQSWIDKSSADKQAQICATLLGTAGVTVTIFDSPEDEDALADWVSAATDNGKFDVLILFGFLPPSLYPAPNLEPDGSVIELFLESTDGDAVLNHADWMFYVSDPINGAAALQNIMDIPGITMGPDNTRMRVTDEGRAIAPHVRDFLSDRPLHVNELAGDWLVEATLAQNADGTRADPVIVKDGDRGRLIPVFMAPDENPMGAVAAEIIAYLMQKEIHPPQPKLTVQGPSLTVTKTPVRITLHFQDAAGETIPFPETVTVQLAVDPANGAFDTDWAGPYDGSITSITVEAGAQSAAFYYRPEEAGEVTLTITADELSPAEFSLRVIQDVPVQPGSIAIYTGRTSWISPADAYNQAQACADALSGMGITDVTIFSDPMEEEDLTIWVEDATDNGQLDSLVLYGVLPGGLYPPGNALPDDSTIELFLESTDGDTVINHADYMFYVSDSINGPGGLQNIMDIPQITMWGDNTAVTLTPEGSAIAPSLTDFVSNRPFHLNELEGDRFPELILAENADGTRADPVIVRDGNRGRLVPAIQTSAVLPPKGQVGAEIIAYL
ncbi:MAG TPA: hypothetical protein ENG36_03535, partial [Lentisphaerae bacterium]|nr:hypothetical protein [Lentisphaerota bacterium]